MPTPRTVFLTVTDRNFFPGTLATVNSVLAFQADADVVVAIDDRDGLSPAQAHLLTVHPRVRLLPACEVAAGRYVAAWELKAYAAAALAEGCYDVLVGIDSDCLITGPLDDVIRRCFSTGGFHGGEDGSGVEYDRGFAPYGFSVPARNPKYMSTSLYFCATTDANRKALSRWGECCDKAEFNGRGPYPVTYNRRRRDFVDRLGRTSAGCRFALTVRRSAPRTRHILSPS